MRELFPGLSPVTPLIILNILENCQMWFRAQFTGKITFGEIKKSVLRDIFYAGPLYGKIL